MDFELPPSFPSSGISWERVLAPLLPGPRGTLGPYSWSPSDLIIPATEPSGSARVVCDQSGFTVQMDVKHFSPEELVVKVTGHFVEVHGKHEQRKGRGEPEPNPATQGIRLEGTHPGQDASPSQGTPSGTRTPDPPESRTRSNPLRHCTPPPVRRIIPKYSLT
uniref:Heat shock protein, alpha-crystallin-related, b6 n=1 Tax=Scleropages formosus TaxID=113540 RepID=A0A8C9R2V5_SCLFO